jgi:hypothetical protein
MGRALGEVVPGGGEEEDYYAKMREALTIQFAQTARKEKKALICKNPAVGVLFL